MKPYVTVEIARERELIFTEYSNNNKSFSGHIDNFGYDPKLLTEKIHVHVTKFIFPNCIKKRVNPRNP